MNQKNVAGIALRLLKGLGAGMTVLFISALFMAYLTGNKMIGEDMPPYGIVLAVLVASAIGSTIFIRGEIHIFSALLYALAQWLVLLAITVLFFDGVFSGVVPTLLLIMSGSVIPLLIGRKKVKRYSSKPPFARYR